MLRRNKFSPAASLRRSFHALAVVLVAVAAGFGAPPTAAQSTRAERFQELREAARARGALPVLVQVGQPVDPREFLNERAHDRAVQALQERRQRVFDDVSRAGRVGKPKWFKYSPSLAVAVDAAALDALERHPFVIDIAEDKVEKTTLAEAVPLIQAPANAWSAGARGQGQAVAILDTGVDKNHPLLAGKVVSEACFSTTFSNATTSSTSLCPGGVESTDANSGLHCSGISGCDHGTHVAGIVAGRDPGGIGINGVAPDASLIAIQVFSRFDTGCGSAAAPCVRTFNSDQIQALEHVFSLRNSFSIASVNMSLGGGQTAAACDTDARKPIIDNLRAAGIAVVIATGNDGFKSSMGFPACISSAISVGATCDVLNTSRCTLGVDSVASYSNITSFTSLVAPGSLILSSVPGGGLANFNGTSMATPMVAGAWALKRQQSPSATVSDILADFRATAVSINDTRTGGVVTDLRRIRFSAPPPPPAPTCTYTLSPTTQSVLATVGTGSFTVSTGPACPWTAVANAPFISTSSSGTGNGTVTYSVLANPTTATRSGTITAGGQTFTVSQAGLEGVTDLVVNGGFEAGDSPWVQSSSLAQSIITTQQDLAFRGSRLAWLGGYNGGTDTIRQDVAIPSNAGTAWLMFAYRVATEEPDSEEARPDKLAVTVSSPANPPEFPPAELFFLSNVDAAATYVDIPPINISRYAGRTVRITFSATMDAARSTSFFIDDVRLLVSAPTSDTVPDPFTIAAQSNVALASQRTSAPLQPVGFDTATTISIGGSGRYSIGCSSTYTADAGSIAPGQTVCVRHTAAATPATATTSRLVIGGVGADFVSTTASALAFTTNASLPVATVGAAYAQTLAASGGVAPYSFALSGGTSLPPGLVLNSAGPLTGTPTTSGSTTFSVQVSDASNQTATRAFTVTTSADTVPDPFSFTSQTQVAPGSTRTSNAVTPGGFNAPAAISVSGGAYSIGCTSTFVTIAGTLSPNVAVCVRHTAASGNSQSVMTTLTIGGVAGTFTSTTASALQLATTTLPDASLGIQYSQALSATGGSPPYSFAVTTGALPGGLALNAATGVIAGTPTAGGSSSFTATVTDAAGQTAFRALTLAVTTRSAPDAFSFAPQRNVPVGSTRTSNTITPTGFNVATPIGVTGGQYSIGCVVGSFTSTAGTLQPGQSVCVQHTASGSANTTVTTTLTIGGVAGTFTSTTAGADPSASASSSSVAFGNQRVGTSSASQTVSVLNGGGGELTVTAITLTQRLGIEFDLQHNCGVLAAGASCQLVTTFSPAILGQRTGSVAVATTAGNLTVALTGNGVPSTATAANVNAVVAGYYETILNRAADAGGLAFWSGETDRVSRLGADIREVFYSMSMQFFSSPEYTGRNTSNDQYVTDLYKTFFSRTPSAAELAFWVGELGAVESRSALLNSFLFSSEFANTMSALFGTANVRPEVNLTMDLFRGIVGRLPDDAGFGFWRDQLRSAQCQGAAAVNAKVTEIANLFFGAPEYAQRNRVVRDFVGDVYNTYLRRGPGGDTAGFNFWVSQVGTLGRDGVRGQFVPSPEFQARVTAIVNAGCVN